MSISYVYLDSGEILLSRIYAELVVASARNSRIETTGLSSQEFFIFHVLLRLRVIRVRSLRRMCSAPGAASLDVYIIGLPAALYRLALWWIDLWWIVSFRRYLLQTHRIDLEIRHSHHIYILRCILYILDCIHIKLRLKIQGLLVVDCYSWAHAEREKRGRQKMSWA